MKLVGFQACEDVRQEMGGKLTLVGTFDGLLISTQALPAIAHVAANLRVQLETNEPSPNVCDVMVRFNEAEVYKASGPVVVTRPDFPIGLSVSMFMFPVDGPGTMTFIFAFSKRGEHDWPPLEFKVPVEILLAK